VGNILRDNILTLFNVMLAIVAFFVLITGVFQQALFIVIIIINSGIGIVTELKAKSTLDKLQLLVQERYQVLRNAQQMTLMAHQLEEGDAVSLSAGSQIPADGVLVEGDVEVNESALTGESTNVLKRAGDEVLSGTTVVVGSCRMRAEKVGNDAFVMKLSSAAKEFRLANSDLRDGINKILKYISFGIVPVAVLLVWTNVSEHGGIETALQTGSWRDAILSASAGIIGMIPEGLVLLTSLNFALATILLAEENVLVAELNSVETLARVDELILDKTGTITDGTVEVLELVDANYDDLVALKALVSLPGGTATSDAIGSFIAANFEDIPATEVDDSHPFDSAKKFSSVVIAGVEYRLGAPDILCPEMDVTKWTSGGLRVLSVTSGGRNTALVVCRERIRENARRIIEYFKSSGVHVQICSGDAQSTVEEIGKEVGVLDVIGRAKPETKLNLVRSLQAAGKVVAMTGDGVNDILALKEADLGIAMGNAAPASKQIANIVLLDSDFGKLPAVVAQGRRVIANIERVASLFLVKTTYSVLLSFSTILLHQNYPFTPIHLSLISALCIGIPAFFLALPPNNTAYRSGFLVRVMKFSVPFGAVCAIIVLLSGYFLAGYAPVAQVAILGFLSFIVVAVKSRPLLSWRGIMLLVLVASFVACFYTPFLAAFFSL
jgi:cation-transporting ATPase E